MKTLYINVRKVENGYTIRIYYGFWDMQGKRFIAESKLEIGKIINDNWKQATIQEQIKDQIV